MLDKFYQELVWKSSKAEKMRLTEEFIGENKLSVKMRMSVMIWGVFVKDLKDIWWKIF